MWAINRSPVGVSDQVGKGRGDWRLCPYLEELASLYYMLVMNNLVGWAFFFSLFTNKKSQSSVKVWIPCGHTMRRTSRLEHVYSNSQTRPSQPHRASFGQCPRITWPASRALGSFPGTVIRRQKKQTRTGPQCLLFLYSLWACVGETYSFSLSICPPIHPSIHLSILPSKGH